MMNSYRRHNKRRYLLVITCIVIFLYIVDIATGGALRTRVRAYTTPLTRWGAGLTSAIRGFHPFSSRAALIAQNEALGARIAELEARASAYDAVVAENVDLRKVVHLAQVTSGVTAPIVSSMHTSPYGTFLIGAGQAESVARGDLVVAENGFAIGRVSDVGAHSSLVTELFAPGTRIDAVLNGAPVTFEGRGGENARGALSRALSVRVGDTVLSPVVGGRAVGVVGSVASSSASATQDVYVRFPFSLSSLRFVYVITLTP
jgi:cell shape-determining protein MreC